LNKTFGKTNLALIARHEENERMKRKGEGMEKGFCVVVFVFLLGSLLIACSSGENGDGAQSISLPISSTSPVTQDTGVALNTEVTITFSRAMDSTTINTQAFTLMGASGGTIPVNTSYSSLKATFKPIDDLALSVSYTATITGIKDAYGIPFVLPYTWTFTTRDGQLPFSSLACSMLPPLRSLWIAVGMAWPFGRNRTACFHSSGLSLTHKVPDGVHHP
jgi:hypothetical protein